MLGQQIHWGWDSLREREVCFQFLLSARQWEVAQFSGRGVGLGDKRLTS